MTLGPTFGRSLARLLSAALLPASIAGFVSISAAAPRSAKNSRRFIAASCFFGHPAMGAGRDRISRDNGNATTAINAAVALATPTMVQVGLSAFEPRSKSAISLARWDSAPAL